MSPEGSELETCCVLTTKPNSLIKPIHNRMPVIIPNGLVEDWMAPTTSPSKLKSLESILSGWDLNGWVAKSIQSPSSLQINLF